MDNTARTVEQRWMEEYEMSKVRICDFCGKVIDEGSKNVKLKVRNNTKKYFGKWDHLDVCENCAIAYAIVYNRSFKFYRGYRKIE